MFRLRKTFLLLVNVVFLSFVLNASEIIMQGEHRNLMEALITQAKNEKEQSSVKSECKKADLIAFSYDRPLQLYSYLESIEKYVKNLDSIQIIYRVSSDAYEKGYQIVKDRFPTVRFLKQSEKTPNDFKDLMLKAIFENSKTEYFLFGVDDIVMTDNVDISECINLMEKENVYGFFLRLGLNINECYTINQKCGTPKCDEAQSGVYIWKFESGQGDWGLPASADMTIYRKGEHKVLFEFLEYNNPNVFECLWINTCDRTKKGLCYQYSKLVNIPLNLVQDLKWHRSMNFCDPDDLLEEFMQGFKLDIKPFEKIRNTAPHVEYVPSFIPRSS